MYVYVRACVCVCACVWGGGGRGGFVKEMRKQPGLGKQTLRLTSSLTVVSSV